MWTVHVNAKIHKENLLAARKLKEIKDTTATAPKRPASPIAEESNKKIKGILKNGNSLKNESNLPSNFFDNKEGPNINKLVSKNKNQNEDNKEEKPAGKVIEEPASDIPEGFFDDPKLDAKV